MNAHRKRAKQLREQLSLEEKAALCSGLNQWQTKPVERLGIPSIWMADGPTGLRKAPRAEEGGLGSSLPATCFPTASALGASWDTALIREVGQAIGRECQAADVQILLAPGVNMKRSPLGGRNFEYFAEDPHLAGELAAAFIIGVQEEGVGTSLKHFAVNNQEFERMFISAEVEERSLREIYLPAFELAIRKAKPWTVMCAYNKVNGTYASEHRRLLHTILKKEWGYTGIVVSDWGAVNDRPAGIHAGLHLEMPSSGGFHDATIVEAVRSGALSEERLDVIVEELIRIILLAHASRRKGITVDEAVHHRLARRVAADCMVLLKNEQEALPLAPQTRLSVIGRFAREPRIQGAGSSQVVPTRQESPWEAIQEYFPGASFAAGYDASDETSDGLIAEACEQAAAAEAAVVFVGLPSRYESESFDRQHIQLPSAHDMLVEAVAAVQPNTIVVLTNGSAVALPWHTKVRAILESWLPGQGGAGAIADILSGRSNPSGKLQETFPKRLEHNPAHLNWPGAARRVHYREGVFIGYRYYDTKALAPLFPFGHGLSYTTFEYAGLSLSTTEMDEKGQLEVNLSVRNTGHRTGKEVVQLYVSPAQPFLPRPSKELRAFTKLDIAPGEQKTATFQLNWRDFAYYYPAMEQWVVDGGDHTILIGASSRDIRLSQAVRLHSSGKPKIAFDAYTPIKEWLRHPDTRQQMEQLMERVWAFYGGKPQDPDALAMMQAHFMDLPLIKLVASSQGAFSRQQLEGMIKKVNR